MLKKIIVVLSICILIVLSGCSNKEEDKFTIGSMSTAEFPPDNPYFLVLPFEWSGSQPAIIDSIKIVIDDIDVQDPEGFSYEFYNGRPNKPVGVYPEYAIGEKQNIQGYEIKDEGILILKVQLSNVIKDNDRQMKIKYSVNGKKENKLYQRQL